MGSIPIRIANLCPVSSGAERPPYKWDAVGAIPTLGTISMVFEGKVESPCGCDPQIRGCKSLRSPQLSLAGVKEALPALNRLGVGPSPTQGTIIVRRIKTLITSLSESTCPRG